MRSEFEIHSCAERGNDVTYFLALLRRQFAGVAELADAYGSGPYGGNPMEVQVLSPAPFEIERPASAGLFRIWGQLQRPAIRSAQLPILL